MNVVYIMRVLVDATPDVLDSTGLAYQAMVMALRIRLGFAFALVLVIPCHVEETSQAQSNSANLGMIIMSEC